MSDSIKHLIPTVEREWNEDIEGDYDDYGFFHTPNGSILISLF